MTSFSFVRKVNHVAAVIGGIIIFLISFLCAFETIARNVFSHPTSWTLDVSTYLLIWAFFLGTASAIQEKTHVSVDFIRNVISSKCGKSYGCFLAVAGYAFSLVYILVLLGTTLSFIKDALHLNKLTLAVIQIPVVYLYAGMLVGCVLMTAIVVFIIRDLLQKGEEYL